MRLFIDASVFFSACYSDRGASFELFQLSLQEKVRLVISDFVLQEVKRNLASKAPENLAVFEEFLNTIEFEVVNPTRTEVLEAADYTELKDAPIVAAARKAGVDYLVSLDQRHLVDKIEVASRSGLEVVLPKIALQSIRQSDETP